jgi:alginate O-acetyltransferase complex protein AlgJ
MNRNAAIRIALAIVAVGFFAAPIAARVVGVTAEAFENKRFAEAPKLSQGWNAFGQATRFLIDRMPLRAQAVRANTRIWTDVFHADPRYAGDGLRQDEALPFAGTADAGGSAEQAAPPTAVQVLRGEDGWLYLQNEHDMACGPPMPFEDALDQWSDLVRIVRASGRRAIVVVPPDKGSVYPEHLPGDFANEDCSRAGKEELWTLLEGSGSRSGVLPLRRRLLAAKRTEREPLYLLKDSHWNSLGSLELVRGVLAEVGDGIRLRDDEILKGHNRYQGDLTILLGAPEEAGRPERVVARKPTARKAPGRTLLIGDSYSDAAQSQLAPFFADFHVVLWVGTPARTIADEVAAADTVIFESVEREFVARATPGGPAGDGFADVLRATLRPR